MSVTTVPQTFSISAPINGFTEELLISDFPARARKLTLHIRRRRWLDEEGKNVILDVYTLANNGTKFSDEFAEFLKKNLDQTPVTAKSLGRSYMIDGGTLEHAYKYKWSDFTEWGQRYHADDWVLLPDNLGERLSIDESCLQDDLFTILSNKAGHGRQGTVIAMVRGTKASDVIAVLSQMPLEERLKVKEVTMDLSESMRSIIEAVFPNARITLDCFHILKRCLDAVEELRLRYKRDAQAETKRQGRQFRAKIKRNAALRKKRRKKRGKKTYKGKVRGPKPKHRNAKFHPPVLENGDTLVELLTRSKHALTQTHEKWSERQKARMRLLFTLYPKLKEAYDNINKLRAIFRSKSLDRESAKGKLHESYQLIADSTIREIKSARDAIKSREDNVLNYFIDRSTNASAESFNSKLKAFRAQLRGYPTCLALCTEYAPSSDNPPISHGLLAVSPYKRSGETI